MHRLRPHEGDDRTKHILHPTWPWAASPECQCCTHVARLFAAHAPNRAPRAAPAEACGAANSCSGVVRGTKVVGQSDARELQRRLPAARRLGLDVPVGAKRGADGLPCFLLNFGLGLFLGGVPGECGWAQKKSSRGHISRKNGPRSHFGFCLPSTTTS